MKNLITLSAVFFSLSSFAQVFDIGLGAIEFAETASKIEKQYKASNVVKDFVADMEQRYGVECSTSARVNYTIPAGRVTYTTKCSGQTPVKIKIVSKPEGNQFKVIKEIIKRK
jgi:hypothetical protein